MPINNTITNNRNDNDIMTKTKNLIMITMMMMFQVKEAGLSEFQELFDHEAYAAINHFTLSTSQVPVALPLSFMGEKIEFR